MALKFVKDSIVKHKVVMFSKPTCPYCIMAKEVFKKLNYKILSIEIDKRSDISEIQDVLGNMTGARTLPRVFIDGKCVGGGTDVQTLYEKGKLTKMLGLA